MFLVPPNKPFRQLDTHMLPNTDTLHVYTATDDTNTHTHTQGSQDHTVFTMLGMSLLAGGGKKRTHN